jgi:hypothetical protein
LAGATDIFDIVTWSLAGIPRASLKTSAMVQGGRKDIEALAGWRKASLTFFVD